MGTPQTALPALDAILAAGHEVTLVVTPPARPAGRSRAPQPPPVKTAALAKALPVIQPVKVRTREFLDAIVAARPEVLAVVAYGRMLVRPVLAAAPHGGVNLHFSMLPAYRGAAPVQWALARGEDETGITTFRLDEGQDTGDILGQRSVAIAPDERAPALLSRLASEGAALLAETLERLDAGSVTPRRQDESRATLAPMLTKEDGFWSVAWSARQLEGRARGFDPWPGVWAVRSGRRLRIADARALPLESTAAAPGTVLGTYGDGIRLACASGTVALVGRVQREAGREMLAREAVRGRLLLEGDRLETPENAA